MDPLRFTDQMGRSVSINYPPRRIISLVPSQTELLFDLRLGEQLAGITKFCIHPAAVYKRVTKVGGTKNLKLDKIRDIRPDLIIGNKEENDQSQVEELMKEFPVWMSDIKDLSDAVEMIEQLGELTATGEHARGIVSQIEERFQSLPSYGRGLNAAYFIWKDPYMLAGRDTFIDDILQRAGLKNVSISNRYPEISTEELRELDPDIIFLSSEPYPFKDVHVKELQRICPAATVMLVDGEMFSWYGSRLLQVPEYLRGIHEKINSNY